MHIMKYFVVGAAGACLDLSIYAILIFYFDTNYLWAGAISFFFSTLVNYFLGIRFVFSKAARFSTPSEVFLVYAASGLGLIFHQTILFIAVTYLAFSLLISKLIAMGSVFFWNYSIRTFYIYKDQDEC